MCDGGCACISTAADFGRRSQSVCYQKRLSELLRGSTSNLQAMHCGEEAAKVKFAELESWLSELDPKVQTLVERAW